MSMRQRAGWRPATRVGTVRLTAGMAGCGGWPRSLLSSRGREAAGLEEGVSDHRHQRVSVQPIHDRPSN